MSSAMGMSTFISNSIIYILKITSSQNLHSDQFEFDSHNKFSQGAHNAINVPEEEYPPKRSLWTDADEPRPSIERIAD
jgi:hypothetical protein